MKIISKLHCLLSGHSRQNSYWVKTVTEKPVDNGYEWCTEYNVNIECVYCEKCGLDKRNEYINELLLPYSEIMDIPMYTYWK